MIIDRKSNYKPRSKQVNHVTQSTLNFDHYGMIAKLSSYSLRLTLVAYPANRLLTEVWSCSCTHIIIVQYNEVVCCRVTVEKLACLQSLVWSLTNNIAVSFWQPFCGEWKTSKHGCTICLPGTVECARNLPWCNATVCCQCLIITKCHKQSHRPGQKMQLITIIMLICEQHHWFPWFNEA